MAKRITNDDRYEIERLWKAGASAKSIAERIGVSHIISQVTVNAIPYTETENAAGGYTVTIAG